MRIARVIGVLTISRRLPDMKPGQYLIADVFDHAALASWKSSPMKVQRAASMAESLIVFDQLGAGVGQIIAVSEGREACMPFWPDRVPIDAYNAAILDHLEVHNPPT